MLPHPLSALRAAHRRRVRVGAADRRRTSRVRRRSRITSADRIRVVGVQLQHGFQHEKPALAVIVGLRDDERLVRVLGAPVEEAGMIGGCPPKAFPTVVFTEL